MENESFAFAELPVELRREIGNSADLPTHLSLILTSIANLKENIKFLSHRIDQTLITVIRNPIHPEKSKWTLVTDECYSNGYMSLLSYLVELSLPIGNDLKDRLLSTLKDPNVQIEPFRGFISNYAKLLEATPANGIPYNEFDLRMIGINGDISHVNKVLKVGFAFPWPYFTLLRASLLAIDSVNVFDLILKEINRTDYNGRLQYRALTTIVTYDRIDLLFECFGSRVVSDKNFRVRVYYRFRDCRCGSQILDYFFKHQLDELKFLKIWEEVCSASVANGNIPGVQYLYENLPLLGRTFVVDDKFIRLAVINGHVAMIRALSTWNLRLNPAAWFMIPNMKAPNHTEMLEALIDILNPLNLKDQLGISAFPSYNWLMNVELFQLLEDRKIFSLADISHNAAKGVLLPVINSDLCQKRDKYVAYRQFLRFILRKLDIRNRYSSDEILALFGPIGFSLLISHRNKVALLELSRSIPFETLKLVTTVTICDLPSLKILCSLAPLTPMYPINGLTIFEHIEVAHFLLYCFMDMFGLTGDWLNLVEKWNSETLIDFKHQNVFQRDKHEAFARSLSDKIK